MSRNQARALRREHRHINAPSYQVGILGIQERTFGRGQWDWILTWWRRCNCKVLQARVYDAPQAQPLNVVAKAASAAASTSSGGAPSSLVAHRVTAAICSPSFLRSFAPSHGPSWIQALARGCFAAPGAPSWRATPGPGHLSNTSAKQKSHDVPWQCCSPGLLWGGQTVVPLARLNAEAVCWQQPPAVCCYPLLSHKSRPNLR